tara:strand:+ start:685 stop:1155 length:471 start_codon:yes stop_codon:yes gene_type:complete
MTIEVTLTWVELWQAALCGCTRRISSMRDGLKKDNNTIGRSNWATDIDGAAAELAYAKSTGQYWSASLNSFKAPDVGDVQIRSTNHPSGHLIVRQNDAENENYVLVICQGSNFKVKGWMLGSEAKDDTYWKDGHHGETGAWWVPQASLKPMKEMVI